MRLLVVLCLLLSGCGVGIGVRFPITGDDLFDVSQVLEDGARLRPCIPVRDDFTLCIVSF